MIPFLILLVIVSAGGAVFLIWRQVLALRRGAAAVPINPTFYVGLISLSDFLVWQISHFFRLGIKSIYVHCLIIGRQLILFIHVLAARVDRRFLKLIHSVRGPGALSKKGSTSFYLTEIKNFRDGVGSGRIDA